MHVQPQARDIIFDFKDSCNCCGRRPDPTRQVYVSRRGTVETFKRSKAPDVDQAVRNALENVQSTIAEVAARYQADPAEVICRLRDEHGIDLRRIAPLTAGTIHRINSAVMEVLESPKTPSAVTVGEPHPGAVDGR